MIKWDFCTSRTTATDYCKVYPGGIPLFTSASKRQILNGFFKLICLPVFLEEGLEERSIGFICCDVCDSLIPVWNQRAAQVCDPLGWQTSVYLLEVSAADVKCHVLRMGDSIPDSIQGGNERISKRQRILISYFFDFPAASTVTFLPALYFLGERSS